MSDIIDELDRLHAKATPGPWVALRSPEDVDECFCISGERQITYERREGYAVEGDDAHLIVALVNAWPALSDRLRKAERERDELRTAVTGAWEVLVGHCETRREVADHLRPHALRLEAGAAAKDQQRKEP